MMTANETRCIVLYDRSVRFYKGRIQEQFCHLGTYSKYTNRPKQNVFYDDEMVGDTINVFIKTKWAGEWDDAKVIKNYQLKIILDE